MSYNKNKHYHYYMWVEHGDGTAEWKCSCGERPSKVFATNSGSVNWRDFFYTFASCVTIVVGVAMCVQAVVQGLGTHIQFGLALYFLLSSSYPLYREMRLNKKEKDEK